MFLPAVPRISSRGASLGRALDRVDEPTDDVALMAAVAERADREAFGQLFRRYAPRVKAHLVARGTPAGIADDLTQETMLLVWRKAALFEPAGAAWRRGCSPSAGTASSITCGGAGGARRSWTSPTKWNRRRTPSSS